MKKNHKFFYFCSAILTLESLLLLKVKKGEIKKTGGLHMSAKNLLETISMITYKTAPMVLLMVYIMKVARFGA
ncbi:hypothetical protein AMJ44_00735 [candidate division WOR-1 bacterium DG_54_3]|uniref:Uncharacterized protein n=1 Tax=candidate division WOR-1 bacterium DG_54_3 TaxID=1703775 RepID=A0A0S7Y5T4_UNCSA|nr:MAG: hypothetical protein AMJ44_00735 [candidate division WOR-1 bacterium DG_54_3]